MCACHFFGKGKEDLASHNFGTPKPRWFAFQGEAPGFQMAFHGLHVDVTRRPTRRTGSISPNIYVSICNPPSQNPRLLLVQGGQVILGRFYQKWAHFTMWQTFADDSFSDNSI